MLGINCSKCNSQLLNLAGYHNRKRLTIGKFCPQCLVFVYYTDEFNNMRDKAIREKKEAKPKPKFLRKVRKACSECLRDHVDVYDKNGKFLRTEKKKSITNRSKWTIRKIPVKKGETQHWKCTCKLCGNVWTQNTSEEYFYYSNDMENQFKNQEVLGL